MRDIKHYPLLLSTVWVSKDGKRSVSVDCECLYKGVRHLYVANLSTKRHSWITLDGLVRKFNMQRK